MHSNKASKGNTDKTLGIYLEFTSSKDWQRRLLRAFEMLLDDKDYRSLTRQIQVLELTRKEKKK